MDGKKEKNLSKLSASPSPRSNYAGKLRARWSGQGHNKLSLEKEDGLPKKDEYGQGEREKRWPRSNNLNETAIKVGVRKCVACRRLGLQAEMIRLTVDYRSNEVCFNRPLIPSKAPHFGRSAYLCRAQECLSAAFKGNRLKFALEGRRAKSGCTKRTIHWPLEPQLIKLISSNCTEP